MDLLLDTNALIWSIFDPPRLGRQARVAVVDPLNRVFVSAVSPWEMAIKVARGKLSVPPNLVAWLPAELAAARLAELPVSIQHAVAVEHLPLHHNDPFDRLLVAQAIAEGLTIVTGDPVFVRVVDLDRNRDATVVETVDVRVSAQVTGDAEVLRLTETGPNTGTFVGYMPTMIGPSAADCVLAVERNAELDATYAFTVEQGRLALRMRRQPPQALDPAFVDAFSQPGGLLFRFIRSGERITGFAIGVGRARNLVFTRTDR